jgi:hypothetical protein
MTTELNQASLTAPQPGKTNWLHVVRDVFLLKTPVFVHFRDSKNGFRTAIFLLIVTTLIATSGTFLWGVVRNPAAEMESVLDGIRQSLQMSGQFGQEVPPALYDFIMAQIESGFDIARNIMALPTTLPQPIPRILEVLGAWLSTPFARLGAWLGYSLWVLLFARLFLRGAGGLRGFLATTALFSVPNMLAILSPIPCVGPLLALVGTLWGWAVYTKGTAVSQGWVIERVGADGMVVSEDVEWSRAILAVILPAVVLILLIGAITVIALLVGTANANQ